MSIVAKRSTAAAIVSAARGTGGSYEAGQPHARAESAPMSVPRGSFRARLAAIVAGAVALRLLYVLVLARHVPMAGDSQFFHAEANLVADGRGYIEPFLDAAYGVHVPTAAHPPLYPT